MYLVSRSYIVDELVSIDDDIPIEFVCDQVTDELTMPFVCKKCGVILCAEELAECYRKQNPPSSFLCKSCS